MRVLFGIALALSIVGTVLLLTTGFPYEITVTTMRYYLIPSMYEVGLVIFLPLLIICMLIMAVLSLIAVSSGKPNISNVVKQARIMAIITLVLAMVAGIVYSVFYYVPFYFLWTLGYCSAILAGLVNAILYSVYLSKNRVPLPVVEQPVVEATLRPVKQGETAKELDFPRKLTKLAEARDEGIITQEEFENRKKQILRDIN